MHEIALDGFILLMQHDLKLNAETDIYMVII